MRFSIANITTAALVLLLNAGPTAASPADIDVRDSPRPAASLCCCDSSRPGYNCKVPEAQGGAEDPICTLQLCPHEPETQKQCCCCFPNSEVFPVKCSAIPKDEECNCPAVYCPFSYGEKYLPGYPWTPAA
ncbi:hypothetical protein CKAH01_10461 [Colletotrichum kahawae]|uniref:Uncharacterized protein n=1 Tax=Colletotrichum kahawae TaxID=34407 RepID=A0AAD9XYY9_COLKA|nr:hypothetical protein CKAH01_10461 [Colletotrichum kahawae]